MTIKILDVIATPSNARGWQSSVKCIAKSGLLCRAALATAALATAALATAALATAALATAALATTILYLFLF
jgi:hypothetical protein